MAHVSIVFVICSYICVPAALIWGWARAAVGRHKATFSSILSLIGFVLATLSALLAAGSAIYARAIGGFPFLDPRVLRIIRLGLVLSAAGMIPALIGMLRPNELRWHAPACNAGMLLVWFYLALEET